MNSKDQISKAQDTFSRVLSFFSRADAKGSVLLALNTGLLALLASNTPPLSAFNKWYMFVPLIPVGLITVSLWHLYRSSFPSLDGGHSSLIYFNEIAKRTESNFISEFKALSDDNYLKDLLGQIWRNSEIAKQKYEHLKWAFIFMSLSILPWLLSLAIFIWRNNLTDGLMKH